MSGPYDAHAVTWFAELIHSLADGVSGCISICAFGEDPTTGSKLKPWVRHHVVGDVAGTIAAIHSQAERRHANVYMPMTVLRLGLGADERGKKSDVVAVLGSVADMDSDRGLTTREAPLPPSFIVSSSPGNFQQFFLFDRPLTVAEAEPIARALRLATGADHGTSDVTHVWRVPGTLNWPNAEKVRRGRPPSPAIVHLAKPWDGRLINQSAMLAALAPWLSSAASQPSTALPDEDEPAIRLADLNPKVADLIVHGAPVGDRSGQFLHVVRTLQRRGHSRWAVHDILNDHPDGIAAKYVGRLEQEVDRVFAKEDPARHFEAVVGSGNETQASTAASASSHPEPLDLFPADDQPQRLELPQRSLPDLLERWSTDTAERLGCPTAFTAVAALTVVSAAIGSRLRLQPKRLDTSWTTPAYLWCAIVEAPGGKKSPAIAAALAPLAKLDAEHSAADLSALRLWERKAKNRRADAPDPGPPPRVRRYKVDAFTMESLRRVLGDNPSGVLVSTDELTQLFATMDAYKSSKGADRPLLLRLFDGGAVTSDRVGAGSHHLTNFGAAVIGGIQPRVIEKLAPDLDADGLLQRFIVINGDGARRLAVDRAPDAAALTAYDNLIGQLVGVEFRFPAPIRLSDDARAIWDVTCERIEQLFGLQQVSDAWRGHLGKWQTILARIILVFHVVDQWPSHGLGIDDVLVSQETARRASRMADFLLAQAVQFYGRYIGMGDAAENARWFAGYLLTHPNVQALNERDVYQARHDLRGPDKRASRLEIFRQLELAGWCSPGEAPVRQWNVNPRIHEMFRAQAEQQRMDRDARRAQAIKAFEVKRSLLESTL